LLKKNVKTNITGYLFSLPYLLGMIIFTLIPTALAVYYSLCDYPMIAPPEFIGLANYKNLLSDEIFAKGLKNSLYFAVLFAPSMTLISLAFAVVLNRAVNYFKGKSLVIIRAIYYFPAIAPWAVIGTIAMWFFNKDVGAINNVIEFFGFDRIAFLTAKSKWFIPSMVSSGVWKGLGYMMFIYLVGLQNIPSSFYEAADIDGASGWHKIKYITIPQLTPTIFFVSIISILWSFNTFEQFYIMGSTINDSDLEGLNLIMYMYNLGFKYFKMGYSTSIAWVLFVITGTITLIQNKLQKYWVHY